MRISDWSSDVCSSDLSHARFDPFGHFEDFQIEMRATGIKLKQLNDFLQAYAGVDAESGDGDIVMQLDAKDGELTGYAKPLFRHVTFFSWKHDVEQQHDNPLQLLDRKSTRLNSSH